MFSLCLRLKVASCIPCPSGLHSRIDACNNEGMRPILMVIILCTAGCANVIDLAVREHLDVAPSIRLGDSLQDVHPRLESAQAGLPQSARKFPDKFMEGDVEVYVYFARSANQPDGITTDDEFTPYVFRNGILTAIGWTTLGGPKTQAQAVSDTYIHITETHYGRY